MKTAVSALLQQSFWLVRVPECIAIVMMAGAATGFYFTPYSDAAFVSLLATAIGYLCWTAWVFQRLLGAPAKHIRKILIENATAFPELPRGDDGEHPNSMTAIFQCLEETLALYRQAVSIAAEAIVTLDEQGIIRSFNPSAARMFGYEPAEIVGQPIARLLSPDSQSDYHQLVPGDRSSARRGHELSALRKDGALFPIYLSLSHVKSGIRGTIIFGVIIDLTLSKKREQEITEARDRTEAAIMTKDSFIANVSHELRTPLNTILGFCEMLRSSGLNPKQQEHLEYVHSCSHSLLAIVNELVELSAMAQGRLKATLHPFNFYKMLRDASAAFELRAKEKSLDFTLEYDSSLPKHYLGDSQKLRQIIGNLLTNSIRFTELGYIKLTAERAQQPAASADIINMRIVVEDSGIGVSIENHEDALNRFIPANHGFMRKFDDVDLSLTVCHELLELMQGRLSYERNQPAGNRFIIELPMTQTNVLAFELPSEAKPDNRLQVLLLGQDADNAALIKDFLTRTPVQLRSVHSGAAAIALLQQEKFDIVLLDLGLPGMDGLETISTLRRLNIADTQGRPIFAAALAGNIPAAERQKYFDIGFDDAISKPASFHSILGLLESYSNRSQRSGTR